jgi:hypothetical protein
MRRPSAATTFSLLALFISLGGTSYAVSQITGKDVRNSSLTGVDVKNSSLTGGDVRNGSLMSGDFATGQLPAGPPGPQGAAGPAGRDGAKGDEGDKGDTGTVDTTNFFTKSESDARHGLIDVQAGPFSSSGAGVRFLGAVQDFEFRGVCSASAVGFRVTNLVPLGRSVIVEVGGGPPVVQPVGANASWDSPMASAQHVRVFSGPATNAFVVDLWGSSTGPNNCDVAAIRHSAVP